MNITSFQFRAARANTRRRGCNTKVAAALLLSILGATAEQTKPFPPHWGEPPKVQTRDLVPWPAGYGSGSGTVARWIQQNLDRDAAGAAKDAAVVYATDFQTVEPGTLPEDFLVLNGQFAVREVDGNRVLELPGAPLESFGLLFGPAAAAGLDVSARIQSESKGRLRPTFGIGLNGVGGFRLLVSPSKGEVNLFRGAEDSGDLLASTSFVWESGTWTRLRLRVVPAGAGKWRVEGKVWPEGADAPASWGLVHETTTEPIPGRPSLWGSPFSGKPILYDNLELRQMTDE